jgi:hypothetical protein
MLRMVSFFFFELHGNAITLRSIEIIQNANLRLETWLQPFGEAYVPGYSAKGTRRIDRFQPVLKDIPRFQQGGVK